ATSVAGTVSYDAATHVATFNPTSSLAANTTFTGRITTGARDVAGNALTINNATFTLTGAGATSVAGTVSYNSATHVATFDPTSPLAANTTFTGTITT